MKAFLNFLDNVAEEINGLAERSLGVMAYASFAILLTFLSSSFISAPKVGLSSRESACHEMFSGQNKSWDLWWAGERDPASLGEIISKNPLSALIPEYGTEGVALSYCYGVSYIHEYANRTRGWRSGYKRSRSVDYLRGALAQYKMQ